MSLLRDDALRILALDALGPLGEALAHEALEQATVTVEPDVTVWEGSRGTMHGDRIVVGLATPLLERVVASHAARDGITAALAAALAARDAARSVYDVRFEPGPPAAAPSSPYRDRGR
jgi:hypothetical protein